MLTATEQFSATAKAPQVREFSAEVRKMQSDLAKMSAGERVAQAGFMSIEDSAIPVFDALGQVRMSMGRQSDGTFAVVYVDGPPPPKPSPPIVAARQLGVYVAIDGTFAGGYARPADVARFDVHMSTTSGFTPDGTTIVGDVTEAGGVLIGGVANVTQYVKVVAVSRAKDSTTGAVIASAPTDEIAVLPLPISQVAVGAIGAQQFAADIGFVSRLLVGNPNAGHVELEGRTGMSPGLFAYDNGLSPTFGLDGLTGSVTMRGTLRSSDDGERLVWREYSWTNSIRSYPTSGSRFAEMLGATLTDGGNVYGGWLLSGPQYNARQTYLWMTHKGASLFRGAASAAGYNSFDVTDDDLIMVNRRNDSSRSTATQISAGRDIAQALVQNASGTTQSWLFLASDMGYLQGSSTTYLGLYASGYAALVTASKRWEFAATSAGVPTMDCRSTDCGIRFNTSGIDIQNYNGGYLYIGAVDISKKSAREAKTDIERPPFDSVEVIRSAPVSQYEYLDDQRDAHGRFKRADKHLGPMADDLPAQLVRAMSDGTPGVLLGSQIAVVWDATARHTETLDDQAETLASLGARVAHLTRRLDALGAA